MLVFVLIFGALVEEVKPEGPDTTDRVVGVRVLRLPGGDVGGENVPDVAPIPNPPILPPIPAIPLSNDEVGGAAA